MKNLKKLLSICLALMMVLTCVPAAFAAEVDDCTIDEDAKASLTIWKFDWTNAYKDGVWDEDSFISTGWRESYVEEVLGETVREPFVEKADEVVEQEMPVPQIVEPETVMIPTEVIEVPEEDPNSEEPEFKPPTILKPFFYRGNDGNWWSQNYKDARRFLYGTKETPPDFENARKLLAEEAEQGNGLAMYDLGKMYLDGLDCDADEIVAQEWFGKALNAFHNKSAWMHRAR